MTRCVLFGTTPISELHLAASESLHVTTELTVNRPASRVCCSIPPTRHGWLATRAIRGIRFEVRWLTPCRPQQRMTIIRYCRSVASSPVVRRKFISCIGVGPIVLERIAFVVIVSLPLFFARTLLYSTRHRFNAAIVFHWPRHSVSER